LYAQWKLPIEPKRNDVFLKKVDYKLSKIPPKSLQLLKVEGKILAMTLNPLWPCKLVIPGAKVLSAKYLSS
jgi:hypothetical protein